VGSAARSRSWRIVSRVAFVRLRRRRSAAMRSRARRRSVSMGLARSARADAAVHAACPEPLEVGPEAAHAREVVLELRQLDLQLALGRAGVVGEDVEDDRRAVDHRDVQLLLEVALLAGHQLVVAGHEVRVRLLDGRLQLGELPAAEVAVRVGPLAALDELAGHRHAGRPEQLAQLAQVRLAGRHADQERALAGSGVAHPLAVACLRVAAVAAPIHLAQV